MIFPSLSRFVLPLVLALLCLSCLSAARGDDEVRYTFADPGAAWAKPDFNARDWQTAPGLSALTRVWHDASEPVLWVRLTQNLSWQQVNNAYFRAAHDGALEIYVNGTLQARDEKPSSGERQYLINPTHDGNVVGRNVYGLHFRAGAGERGIEVEHVIGEWVPVEERVVRSNPIFPEHTRDSEVCLGPDGKYYLAATSGDPGFFSGPKAWLWNEGIMLRRSDDLIHWDNLGWVWTFDRDGTWNKEAGTFGKRPARAVWAPEISYFNGRYWLAYSVNHTTPAHAHGIGILHADKPAGPWQEVTPGHPVVSGYDPSLFRDDDGKVYLIYNRCSIARMKDDLSGPAEPFRTVAPANFPNVGFEGPCILKYKGRYHMIAAEGVFHADGKTSYDAVAASADRIYGPYGPRYVAIRYGGHNGFFVDKEGQLRATVWKLPDANEMITIPRIELSPEGLLRPVLEDCLPPAPAK